MGRPTGATREGECVLHGAPWPVEVRWEKERRRREKNHHYDRFSCVIFEVRTISAISFFPRPFTHDHHHPMPSNALRHRRASDPPRGRMTGSGQPAPLQGLQGATDEVLPRTPHRSPPTSSPKKPPANTRKNSRVMAVRFLTAGVRVYDHDGGRAS